MTNNKVVHQPQKNHIHINRIVYFVMILGMVNDEKQNFIT